MGDDTVGGIYLKVNSPVADSCRCMAKPIQYCKVINHQLKKRKPSGKRLREEWHLFAEEWKSLERA